MLPLVTEQDVRGHEFVPWTELLAPGEKEVQEAVGRDERAATVLCGYSNTVVIGLLQTRAYAYGILSEWIAHYGLPGSVDDAVDARLGRQAIFAEPGRSFRLVQHEDSLYLRVGSVATMRGQLEHLETVALAGIDGADLRFGMLPRTTPYKVYMPTRSFHLNGDVAEEETIAGVLTVRTAEQVAEYEQAFAYVADNAVYGEDAARMIAEARADLPTA